MNQSPLYKRLKTDSPLTNEINNMFETYRNTSGYIAGQFDEIVYIYFIIIQGFFNDTLPSKVLKEFEDEGFPNNLSMKILKNYLDAKYSDDWYYFMEEIIKKKYCLSTKFLLSRKYSFLIEEAIQYNNYHQSPSETPITSSKSLIPDISKSYFVESVAMHNQNNLVGYKVLENQIDKLKDSNNNFHRIIPLLQSSGYGKTKACFDLMKGKRAVYLICNSGLMGINFPRIFNETFQRFKETQPLERTKFAAKLLASIVDVASEYEDTTALYNAQFETNDFYSKLGTRWTTFTSPEKPKVTFSSADNSLPNITSMDNNLIIIFDEISELLIQNEPNNLYSPIQCLCRIINKSDLIGILLSTTSSYKAIVSRHHQSTPSDIPKLHFPVVYQIYFTNQFREHLFVFGRPLWYSYLTSNENDYGKLLRFAYSKLIGRLTNPREIASVVLAVRFALKPVSAYSAQLVANHLATLIGFTKDTENMIVKYHSEPILAEVSARVTCESIPFSSIRKISMVDCVDCLLERLRPENASFYADPNKKDLEEIVAAVGLTYTADKIRESILQNTYNSVYSNDDIKQTMSAEIPVTTFLQAICNSMDVGYESIHAFDGWMMNLTHFIHENVTKDTIRIAYRQNSAILKRGTTSPGYDLIIVIKKKNTNPNLTEYGLLVIQVKNHKLVLQPEERKEIIDNCNPGLFYHVVPTNNVITVLLTVGTQNTIPPVCIQSKSFPSMKTHSTTPTPWLCIETGLDYFCLLNKNVIDKLNTIASGYVLPTEIENIGIHAEFAFPYEESNDEKDVEEAI